MYKQIKLILMYLLAVTSFCTTLYAGGSVYYPETHDNVKQCATGKYNSDVYDFIKKAKTCSLDPQNTKKHGKKGEFNAATCTFDNGTVMENLWIPTAKGQLTGADLKEALIHQYEPITCMKKELLYDYEHAAKKFVFTEHETANHKDSDSTMRLLSE